MHCPSNHPGASSCAEICGNCTIAGNSAFGYEFDNLKHIVEERILSVLCKLFLVSEGHSASNLSLGLWRDKIMGVNLSPEDEKTNPVRGCFATGQSTQRSAPDLSTR